LVSLGGLQNITGLGRNVQGNSLYIRNNAALESLSGLSSMRGELPGALTIVGSEKLVSLEGLGGIHGLQNNIAGESLRICNNLALSSLDALSGIQGQVHGALILAGNDQLLSLEGLRNIAGFGSTIAGDSLFIEGNQALRSLAGLSNVVGELPGALTIRENPNLLSLQGLEGIKAVSCYAADSCLKITQNAALRSLEAITKLIGSVGTPRLDLQDLNCDAGWYQQHASLACRFCGHDFVSAPASFVVPGQDVSDVCHSCRFWEEPNDRQDECQMVVWFTIGLLTSFFSFLMGCTLLGAQLQLTQSFSSHWEILGRSMQISDISYERGVGVVLTTPSYHGFYSRCSHSFPIKLRGTGNSLLHTREMVGLRARVINKDSFELLDSLGGTLALDGKADASMGEVAVIAWQSLLHSGKCIPNAITMPLLLLVGLSGFATIGVKTEQYTVVGVSALVAVAASVVASILRKWCEMATPLQRRLALYQQKLLKQNPKPRACEPGPGRALHVDQILDLHDFFKGFIQMRNMHYLEPNIIRRLTLPYRLSYAEVAGPSSVQWFVSHCWLHPFAATCSALEKHARRVAGHGQWQGLAYWFCTFCNNQYDLDRELGNGHWERSSFYLALMDAGCQGTCMILDENLHPFGRSWCLFELLISIMKCEGAAIGAHDVLSNTSEIMFCTSSGILNRGEASVEVSLNIGRRASHVRLENAAASVQSDKDMIDQLVISRMGGFENINAKLQASMASALEASKAAVINEFDKVRLQT